MELFRRKQKLIFWIVTLIIVPSFVIVWGTGGLSRWDRQQGQEFEVGTVDGKKLKYHEFENFRKRIQAAVGGVPLQFAGAPGRGTPAEELYKYIFTYAILQDAEKAGSRASELQVGTYLENGHPTLAAAYKKDDPKSMDRAVDTMCRQMQLSRQDFLQGVREWQTIGNYVIADANLAAVNDDTVFTFYAFNRAQCVIKRIRLVATDSIKEQARKDIMERPADELQEQIRVYAAGKSAETRYRTPSAWRFAYLLEPFVPETAVRQPTEDEINAQYEAGKTYLYKDAPLDEVRDRIKSELLHVEIERQTLRNFTVDIDPQLRGQAANLTLDELVKLTPIAKFGVTAGTTGDELLEIPELAKKLPPGSDAEIRVILESLDAEAGQMRDTFMKEWKDAFNLGLRPFKADTGYYRLRLLDYRPSAPAPIDGPDGKVRPEIFELAVSDMIADRVDELVEQQALDMEKRLRQYSEAKETGKEVDANMTKELDALPAETLTYQQIADRHYEIGRLVVGDLYGPAPFEDGTASGQEIILLVDRRVPSRADFEAETADVKARFRQMALTNYRGNYGFTYTMSGPNAVIQPSPVIMGSIADRFNKREISINPELLRSFNPEG